MDYQEQVNSSEELGELKDLCSSCTMCSLSETRNNVVFGEGPSNAGVMFIGEAPGYHEDLRGVPFVGAAGMLMNSLLIDCFITRTDLYITNTIKCRPVNNENPSESSKRACKIFLKKQLEIVKPRLIVTVGLVATKLFIPDEKRGITKIHGEMITTKTGRTIMPMIHPAAALRNNEYIPMIESDLQNVRRILYP